MKYSFLLFFLSLLTFTCCNEGMDESLLQGSWAAAAFIEQGKPKDVEAQNIRFQFFDNNTYAYKTLNYQEAGNFNLQGRTLYTTDTLADQRIRKSVKVIHATGDSLHFKMNAGGIEQIIQLYKTK